ncbi:ATP-dependent RNA helicase MSS116 [Cordyceps militaris CM01]|uniref:ATP-dependent RNA helicase n=1 Tax=Cordyceps militaris (strain CM01) TaxID=983644 RepID=G3JRY4_CORMM|nr:ATP-dependent RNA helicase MSS116 [Cordyceps militaris CM01]EGX88630.1 ATP-dependent RNA helicase MSS116 [Cordyceps militaris CM01]
MPDRGGREGQRTDRRRGGGGGGGGRGGGHRGNFRGNRRGGRGGSNNRADNGGTDSPMSIDLDETPSHTPPQQATTDYKPPLTEAVPLDTPRFADLAGQNLVHPLLIQTITDDLKFNHMMPVQAATLWELLPPNRSDCLVQAKTGTGKTVAFLLPALQTMLSKSRGGNGAESTISLLVISPTRELAMQIAAEASSLLQRMPRYKVRIAIGGTNKDREERMLHEGCDVLIATPGRLLDHMANEDVLYALRALDTLVLDEADRLLDMGFMPALRDIVGKLPNRAQVPRQGMLFSATIAPHVKQVAGLVLQTGYKFISTIAEGEAGTHERVPQHLIKVPSFSSVAAGMVGAVRAEAAREPNLKAIVFAPTAALAGLYGHVLGQIPGLPPVSTLHSRMTQNRRTKVTNEYRDAKSAILTATDVVARGMDFPGVTTVFQVGIPSEKQSYIHRLGRTARADAEGKGIFLIAEAEAFFPRWTLKEIAFVPQEADLSAAPEIERIMDGMDEEEKGQIYKAWLGYYNNHMKGLHWDKEELVRQANTYAREGLSAPETPPIQRSTVGKMGLRGTRGLNIVPDRAKPPRGRGGRGGH